jgi:hypothetical protein
MMFENSQKLLALAGVSGVSAHTLLYRHGEWDLKAPAIFVSYIALLIAATAAQGVLNLTGTQDVAPLSKMVMYHIAGVYLSMLVYRAFFHRLSKFSGPFFARLSNFYVTALSAKKLQLCDEIKKLHLQYGDYVRIGMMPFLI